MKSPEEIARSLWHFNKRGEFEVNATAALRAYALEVLDEVEHEYRNAPRGVGVIGAIAIARQRVATGAGA